MHAMSIRLDDYRYLDIIDLVGGQSLLSHALRSFAKSMEMRNHDSAH